MTLDQWGGAAILLGDELDPQSTARQHGHVRAFYRSLTFRLALIIVGLTSAWSCLFGPEQWRTTPSLRLVRSYGLPWWAWGLIFLGFTALLCIPDVRWHVWADWLGLGVYGLFWCSLLAATRTDRPGNLMITGLAAIGLVAIYQAAKLATFDREGL